MELTQSLQTMKDQQIQAKKEQWQQRLLTLRETLDQRAQERKQNKLIFIKNLKVISEREPVHVKLEKQFMTQVYEPLIKQKKDSIKEWLEAKT